MQFNQSGRWFLYAAHADAGYAQSKTFVYDEETGKTSTRLYWTQKGRLFIYETLKHECGLLPLIEPEVTQ